MRCRRALVLLVGALALTSSASAADVVPWSRDAPEYWVGQAGLAASFYEWDRRTYSGMTVAKLRRMNSALRNVRVVRATKKTYCIEARVNGLAALQNGPGTMIRRGSCAAPRRATAVPPDPRPEPTVTTAVRNVRAAGPALAAFAEDNRGYARLTVAGLEEWDQSIVDLRVAWAERATFCIESAAADGSEAHWEFGEHVDTGLCPTTR